jgi:uncharacterized membrane protein
MKEAKLISFGRTLCFLAISTALLLNASICGFAQCFATSYEIAPCRSKSLIRCSSLIVSMTVILRHLVIRSRFITRRFYEEVKKMEPVKNRRHNPVGAIRAGSIKEASA